MGSQQLLLLIVGVLMVGLMISVGIIMFADNAAASNRDAVANDLAAYASKAQVVLSRDPRCLGGGGGLVSGICTGEACKWTNPERDHHNLHRQRPTSERPSRVWALNRGMTR